LLTKPDCINGIKIIDFGLSVQIESYISSKSGDKNQSGTLLYLPPEVISGTDNRTTPAIDVWSIGVLAYQLVTGRLPFGLTFDGEISQIRIAIMQDDVKELGGGVPPELASLIGKMLEKNPLRRIKMYEIMQNTWLFPKRAKVF
jgi:serine/threonine protein kinase